jgi:hypothetical protein
MKNIILVIAIAVFTLVANFVNASETLSGNSLTKFGNYQLVPSSNSVVIDDKAYQTWELSYSGTPEKYVLFVIPGEEGNCCFNIRGAGFEIRYSVSSNSFGAKLVDPAFRTLSRKEVMKRVNSEQLKSQEVIVDSPKSQEEYLGLIACFMPLLMN